MPLRHVHFVPQPDSCTAANSYSITSSARSGNLDGISSPIAVAAFHVNDELEFGRLTKGHVTRISAFEPWR